MLLLGGCMSRTTKPTHIINNPPPVIPFNVLDVDSNGTISKAEYLNHNVGSYSTEEPIITMIVIVFCVVLLTGGLAWVYRSSDSKYIYDKEE